MKQRAGSRARITVAVLTALVSALLGLLLRLPGNPLGTSLARSSYDSLHNLAPRPELTVQNSPVTLIYLDLESYFAAGQDPAKPWSRALHADLVRRLQKAGARAVVFDMLFDQPALNPEDDRQFAQAIRDDGHVILAAELGSGSHASGTNEWTKTLKQLLPHAPLFEAAAGWGLASLRVDDDFLVRRHFEGFPNQNQPSLTMAAGRVVGLPPVPASSSRWLRYYGGPLSIPHVSYHDAAGVPDDFFRDKIVFIGARPIVGLFNERRDELRNPFHIQDDNRVFMPAVEVHASQMLNLVRSDWLERLQPGTEAACLLAVGVMFGVGLLWLRPVAATLVSACGAGGMLLGAAWSFGHGTWFPWLIAAAVQLPVAWLGSILFHFVDWYTTRKRLEAAKRVADARIREQAALIDKAHDAIFVQDMNGQVLYLNPSAERLYGWSLQEVQQNAFLDKLLAADKARVAEARAATLSKGEWNGEFRQQNRAGAPLVVASRWTLIRDEDAQPHALLVINSDITEKKLLEEQFLRTQRLETIGSLAGGMAHDLNNALSPIMMGVQLLRRRSEDEEARRLLALIEASTYRSAEMVRQVLLFARGKGGDIQRLPVAPLVKEIEKIVRETFPKNITVESYLPKDVWPMRGNPTQLHQVLLNLCVNARDAMPEGGRLTLAADNLELSAKEASRIPGGLPGAFVSLMISDTGTGIPPEVLAKIFQPFFTTKGEGKGTGLGLATVQRIVKSLGGFVRVESEPGQGATFEVLLPRASESEADPAALEAHKLPRGNGEWILIADDEQAIREVLAEGLAAHGYKVLLASNGVEALELFRKNPMIAIFVTDSEMPIMDGARAIAELHELRPELPVIRMAGEAPEAATAAERINVLKKPFSLEQILLAVAQSLARH